MNLEEPHTERVLIDGTVGEQPRTMKTHLVRAHFLLEKDRIRSWKQFEKDLSR